MRTLKRPMFKIGGKAEAGNDGIMDGLVDRDQRAGGGNIGGGTMAGSNLGTRSGFAIINEFGQPYEPASTGSSTSTTSSSSRLPVKNLKSSIFSGKNLPTGPQSSRIMELFKRFPKSAGISGFGLGAGVGIGGGLLADYIAKSTSTPEGYKRLKEMGGAGFNFDETNPDVGDIYDYIAEGNTIGEKAGFLPRGGKKKFFEDKDLDPETGLTKEIDDMEITGDIAKVKPGQTAMDAVFDQGTKRALDKDDDTSKIRTKDTGSNQVTQAEKNELLKARAKEFEELLNPGARKRVINNALAAASAEFGKSTGNTMSDIANAITAAAGATGKMDETKQKAAELAIGEEIQTRIAKAKDKPNATQSLINFYRDSGLSDKEIADKISKTSESELDFIKAYSTPSQAKAAYVSQIESKNIDNFGGVLSNDKKARAEELKTLDSGKVYYDSAQDAYVKIVTSEGKATTQIFKKR